MSNLVDRKCEPCEGGVEPIAADYAGTLLASLHQDWQLGEDGRCIKREYSFPVFSQTIAFVNAVAWIATIEGHHPDVRFTYGTCSVVYSTTAIGGLSENDFICAAKIDRITTDL